MSPIQHASRWRGICVSVILYLAISIYLGLRQIAAGALPEERQVGTGPRYLIDSWQTEDGLPQNSVTCMAQTPDGYFWLGTFNGLVRFDGVRFVVFDAGTTPELASSRIVALHADKQGRLWIQSEFGDLSLLEGGRFKSLRDRWGKVAFPIEDPQGKMWFFRQTAVEQFEHGARIPLTEYDGTDLGWVRDVVCDAHGTFWAVRKRGIGFSQDGHFVFSSSLPAGSEPPDKVAPSRDGGLWVAYKSSGLAKFHAGKPILEARPFPVIGAGAKALYEDSRGNVWVGTESNGLFLLTTNGQWEVFNKAGRLSHDSIRVVQEDPEGNIWVGTDGGGLNRLSLRTFAAYGAELGVVLTVTEDRQGQLWVGYNGAGIKRLEGGQMQPVSFPPLLGKQGACWSLYADRQGSVWTGDVMGGLVQMGVQGCLHHPNQDANVSPSLKALYEDRSGRLWAGHQPGLLYYTKGQFRRLTREDGLPVDDVRALTEDEEGDLYIGTNGGGLVRRHAGQSQVYTRASGLPDDRVWSLYGDGEGAVWVGTFGSGLGRFSGGKFFNYGEAIPARVVTCIIEDDAGYLWLGSLKGILRVKRSDLNAFAEGRAGAPAFQKYDKTDGLESIECSGGLQPA
ncbi:MAG TPA: two-component regulator propeller domain-containing protein, partial [Candidatus Limnocylindria bacterium]|nr:two-component regulator propeller domain-containing protein [Candidatus Limnocylindria bacterium]